MVVKKRAVALSLAKPTTTCRVDRRIMDLPWSLNAQGQTVSPLLAAMAAGREGALRWIITA